MKLGVSSYSFKKMIESGETTQLGTIALAKKLGFADIEFTDLTPHDGSSEMQYSQKIKAECKDSGLEIGSYTISADLLNGYGVAPEKETDRIKRKLDVASQLGAKLIRHDATWGVKDAKYQSFDSLLPYLADKCREITCYAKTLGIKTTVENHGFFVQDSERVEKLINAVADENFGALLDMGNFLCADEDPCAAVGRLAPYALRVHAKDFHTKSGSLPNPGKGWFTSRGGNYLRGAIIGHGDVPVMQCLKMLEKAGYSGTVAIEFEGLEHPMQGLEIGLDNIKRYINL
jgi:sugar phosphate isomerase/epimerase